MENILKLEEGHTREMLYRAPYFANMLWTSVSEIQSFLKKRPDFKFGKGGSIITQDDYEARSLKDLRNSSIETLKKFTDTRYTPMASIRAIEKFKEFKKNNPNFKYDTVYECTYPERNKIDLLREHPESNASFFDRLVRECHNVAQIAVELSYHPGTCWVTKEEDQALRDNGYVTNRPLGWKVAYIECGIEAKRYGNCVNCK